MSYPGPGKDRVVAKKLHHLPQSRTRPVPKGAEIAPGQRTKPSPRAAERPRTTSRDLFGGLFTGEKGTREYAEGASRRHGARAGEMLQTRFDPAWSGFCTNVRGEGSRDEMPVCHDSPG